MAKKTKGAEKVIAETEDINTPVESPMSTETNVVLDEDTPAEIENADTPVESPMNTEIIVDDMVLKKDFVVMEESAPANTESNAVDLDAALDAALASAASALGISAISALPTTPENTPLDDADIYAVITPILEFAGNVDVETAGPLVVSEPSDASDDDDNISENSNSPEIIENP